MIKATLNQADVRRVLKTITATPKQVDRASRASINRTLGWGVTQIVRGLAEHHDLPAKVIRGKSANPNNQGKKNADRVRIKKPPRGHETGYIWVGAGPIKAGYAGRLRQTRARAGVRSHRFTGAFVAAMSSGHQGIFKRTGRYRTPVAEESITLHTAQGVVNYVNRRLSGRLRLEMDRQLDYQLKHRGR